MSDVSFLIAFSAGLLSFLSPCVLPIIPGYISYLSGMGGTGRAGRVVLSAFFFVLGFTVVFTLMGASATFVGQLLRDYQLYIARLGGGLVVFFGFHFAGLFLRENFMREFGAIMAFTVALYTFGVLSQRTFMDVLGVLLVVLALYLLNVHQKLYQQMRLESKGQLPIVGSFLVGVAFASGWTPCIGPVLGTILLYASQQETARQGALLLLSYSMGLGVPFILAGLFLSAFLGFVRRFSKFFRWVEIVGGVLLVTIGLLLATGKLAVLSGVLQ
ncbi:cytochrome c biogenesis protein transmembrane region [Thermocrinis albus DSM 14484]|uniref:Cytochrome c biogenesis protein transmembrane region n=1 Tax=Thermocrinis albus (strain DSM 14484 / JCM 11386 / HI 11/12) TaxID=638303 RepID=D3SLM4_THEAH|nr:cytochrome c biogenesis protein CcdA [Thermocrinis albus]ADC89654.1 cytochrome c biogenesis protein transmembrane region [Thermocrinis albus DSM 14484]